MKPPRSGLPLPRYVSRKLLKRGVWGYFFEGHDPFIKAGCPVPRQALGTDYAKALTERQEELIETLVKSGRYQNASEVLRDGLRLVEQREAEDKGKLKALRAAARIGVSALDRGEFKEFESIQDLQAYLNDLSEKVISKTAE
jgi:antitoxin ParD1/3/4